MSNYYGPQPNPSGPQQNPNPYGPPSGPQQNPNPYGPPSGPQQNPNPYGPPSGPQQNPNPYGPPSGPQQNPNPYGPPSGPQQNPNPYGPPSGPSTYDGSTVPAAPYTPQQTVLSNPYASQPQPQTQAPPQSFGMGMPSMPYQPAPASPPSSPPRRGLSIGTIVLILIVVVLLIGGSALIYYAAVYRPNLLNQQATSTAVAQVTGTAQSNVTGTAQVQNATSTAIAQATAAVVATQTALQLIYTQGTSGTPAITDTLSQADNNGWSHFASAGGSCTFPGGSYHVTARPGYFTPCVASVGTFGDMAIQVTMTFVSGNTSDKGGLILRADNNSQGYYFFLKPDGSYNLLKVAVDSSRQSHSTSLVMGQAPVNPGNNVLTVIAKGNTFYLYLNKQYVTMTTDPSRTYTSGQVGVFVDSGGNSVDMGFSNIAVWRL